MGGFDGGGGGGHKACEGSAWPAEGVRFVIDRRQWLSRRMLSSAASTHTHTCPRPIQHGEKGWGKKICLRTFPESFKLKITLKCELSSFQNPLTPVFNIKIRSKAGPNVRANFETNPMPDQIFCTIKDAPSKMWYVLRYLISNRYHDLTTVFRCSTKIGNQHDCPSDLNTLDEFPLTLIKTNKSLIWTNCFHRRFKILKKILFTINIIHDAHSVVSHTLIRTIII